MKDEEIKLQYQVQISSRFDALITSNENADEVDINDTWENIRDNIKVAAGESIGYYEVKKKKPWCDDVCSNVVERRIQGKLKFLQDPTQYRVLVGKAEGKRHLGRPWRRWEDNIRMDLREVGCVMLETGLILLKIGSNGGLM